MWVLDLVQVCWMLLFFNNDCRAATFSGNVHGRRLLGSDVDAWLLDVQFCDGSGRIFTKEWWSSAKCGKLLLREACVIRVWAIYGVHRYGASTG